MSYRLDWARDDGEAGTQMFASEDEAEEAARGVAGVALVIRVSGSSATVFRNGRELEGADASDAFAKFGHRIEVGVSRAEEPDTNVDPDDATGSGWRPGTPAVYGWRLETGPGSRCVGRYVRDS